jgi:hypothetical protein
MSGSDAARGELRAVLKGNPYEDSFCLERSLVHSGTVKGAAAPGLTTFWRVRLKFVLYVGTRCPPELQLFHETLLGRKKCPYRM